MVWNVLGCLAGFGGRVGGAMLTLGRGEGVFGVLHAVP